jgi:hypothetical protein
VRFGVAMKVKDFCDVIRRHYSKHTFETAYAHSKRSVSITATKIQNGVSTPVLLNYRTTPHVLIWSAVAASCALPGLMNPITLMMLPPEIDGLSDDEVGKLVRCLLSPLRLWFLLTVYRIVCSFPDTPSYSHVSHDSLSLAFAPFASSPLAAHLMCICAYGVVRCCVVVLLCCVTRLLVVCQPIRQALSSVTVAFGLTCR